MLPTTMVVSGDLGPPVASRLRLMSNQLNITSTSPDSVTHSHNGVLGGIVKREIPTPISPPTFARTITFQDGRKESLLFRFRTSVPHIEHNLPASVFLLLPDAGVLAVVDNRLPVFIFRAKFVSAEGVA
jgi:hypothetical protein